MGGLGAISSPGIGSGLDINNIVTALVDAQIAPRKNQILQQTTSAQTQLSAMGQILSSLSKLQNALSSLIGTGQTVSKQATLSNNSYFTAAVDSTAHSDSYSIAVQQLAQSQSIANEHSIAASTVFALPGTITIHSGQYTTLDGFTSFSDAEGLNPVTITIPDNGSGYSLQELSNAINASSAGVTTSIVSDNSGSKLVFTSNSTGTANAIKIDATDSLSSFIYDASSNAPAQTMEQTIAAQDSIVLVNGVTLTNSSNTIANSISGVTLNLIQADSGVTTSLTVGDNTSNLSATIQSFVTSYNATQGFLSSLTSYDSGSQLAGPLNGDAFVNGLMHQLRNLVSNFGNSGNEGINSLVDIGITFNESGQLHLNQIELNTALSQNYQAVNSLFGKSATITNPNLFVTNISSSIKAGTYAVELTSAFPLTGTIGGLTATLNANGTTLQATGVLQGLNVNILPGTSTGGTITVKNGLAVQLDAFINSYTNSSTGMLESQTTSLNSTLRRLSNQNDELEQRQVALQGSLMAQYTNLDTVLAGLQRTTSSLETQLSQLSNLNRQVYGK